MERASVSGSTGSSLHESLDAAHPPAPPERLGILFIHGMGEHRRGDTLRRFGEPIYAWLDSWRASSDQRPTLFTDDTSLRLPRLDDPDAPPHTRIMITWPDLDGSAGPDAPPVRTQTWFAAEAWWADEFNPPAFSEVASWSMALAPGLLVRYLRASLGRSRVWGWSALPLGYLASGIFQIVLLALLALGIIPPLRRFVAGFQVLLTGALGDPLVMVASPIRFNAILSRIERNLAWLRKQGCDRIAVVAHSQGTGIGLRVLQRGSERVELFVTFGAAIEKLHLAAELQAIRRRLSIAITVSAVSLVVIVAAWIVAIVVPGEFDLVASWIGGSIALMLLVGCWITWWSDGQIAKVGPPDLTVPVESKDGTTRESKPLVWRDIWTISDPFPDEGLPPWVGPTPPDLRHLDRETRETVNRSATLQDHSIYEENHEGFVGPVFCHLATLAELDPALAEKLTAPLAAADARRRVRVSCLSLSRWIAVAAAVLLTVLSLARDELVGIGRPLFAGLRSISAWLGVAFIKDVKDAPWVSAVIGAVLIAVLVAAWYRLAIAQGWRIWDKAEADRLSIGLLALPVAEGPFVLDAGKGSDRGGVRESDTPADIAALDRINGAWLFFAAVLALPAALLMMTILKGKEDPYSGDWSFLDNAWLRWGIAGVMLVLCAAAFWRLMGKALGGWDVPWRVLARRSYP